MNPLPLKTPAMKTLLFLDLDDTVLQTRHKALRHHGVDDAALTATAYLADGQAHGFTTPAQRHFLHLMRGCSMIPTTARSLDSYQRVQLGMAAPEWGTPEWVILNHGGTLLDAALQPHPDWQAHMQGVMQPWLPVLEDLRQVMEPWLAQHTPSLYVRLIGDMGQTFYVLVKDQLKLHASTLPQLIDDFLQPWLAPYPELVVHHNGNNLTVMPKALDKAHAVAFLIDHYRRNHDELLILGAGDSQSDADFLKHCDYALIPKHAQLMHRL